TIYHHLAFEIEPAIGTKFPLLMDAGGEFRDFGDEYRQVEPTLEAAKGFSSEQTNALFALQCYSRGWTKLAQHLLELSQKDQREGLKKTLVLYAWSYWDGQVNKPKFGLAQVANRLKQIIELEKKLDTKENREQIKELEIALAPTKAKPGSVEALIDD